MTYVTETQNAQPNGLRALLLGETLQRYDTFTNETIGTIEQVAELLPEHSPERRILQFKARPELLDKPYDALEYQVGALVAASMVRAIEPRPGAFLPNDRELGEEDWLDRYIQPTAQSGRRYVVTQFFAESARGRKKMDALLGRLGALGFRYANHQAVHEADSQQLIGERGDPQDFAIVGMGDLLAWIHAHRTGHDALQKKPLV